MQTKLYFFDSDTFKKVRQTNIENSIDYWKRRCAGLEGYINSKKYQIKTMKKLSLILLIALVYCKPIKKRTIITKSKLIDAIASGSKLTKVDAGREL